MKRPITLAVSVLAASSALAGTPLVSDDVQRGAVSPIFGITIPEG